MKSSGADAVAAPARHAGHMSKRRAVFLLGGHGARDEGSKRSSRSETEDDQFLPLRGDTNVIIFTPVGDSREGVSSGQILKKGVYTNTSLAPSIAVALVCGKDKCDRRMLLNKMAEQLKLHDKLADIVYTNPGNLFQINPIEDKNVWQIYMGEQFRQPDKGATKVTFARVAAGDEIHFPFGLTFLTLYDENGSLYKEPLMDSKGQPTIASFMLENNCDLIKAKFLKKPDLLKKLEEIDSIVTDIVEPFAQSATKGVKTHWADLNLLSARNSGQINRAITKIADDAESRIKSGTGTEHDEWLVANRELVIFFLNEVQTTKQSKLSKLVFICKYILPPGIDIEIVDLTCSSDFTEQPKWGSVNVPTPDSVGSYKDQADSPASTSSSVLSLSDVNIAADIHDESSWRDTLLEGLWSGWEGITSFLSTAVARAAPRGGHDVARAPPPPPPPPETPTAVSWWFPRFLEFNAATAPATSSVAGEVPMEMSAPIAQNSMLPPASRRSQYAASNVVSNDPSSNGRRGRSRSRERGETGGSRKTRKRTTVRRKKITRKTKKRAYKKKSQKRNRRK